MSQDDLTPQQLADQIFNLKQQIKQYSDLIDSLSTQLMALEETVDPGLLYQAQLLVTQMWNRFIS
jgi:DNA-binding transcriptional regulator PaaX